MHVITELALMAGVIAVAAPMATTFESRATATEPNAMARFVNNTPGLATLLANGEALFSDVPAGQVTDYAQVTDSTVTFSLEIRDRPGDSVSVNQVVEEGARYTLTAKVDMDGRPTLTLVREEQVPRVARSEW